MTSAQASLRRFAASATSFANNVRRDLFWRTEFIIIGILFTLCVANIVIVAVSSHYLHLSVAEVVVESITATIADGNLDPSATGVDMISRLEAIRDSHLLFAGSVSIILTIFFGYIAARVALKPTRSALVGQKQFIANVAHELRTPLSIVKANNEILAIEAATDPEVVSLTESTIEELDRISAIINNLLTLNTFRYEEHRDFTAVDLNAVVKDSTKKFEHLANEKGIELRLDLTEDLSAHGDESALAQIAMNLIKNAIHYTPSGGTITIATRSGANRFVEFEVSDTGIGIERDKLSQIFQPFYQVDPSRSHHKSSSGLGLAIVRELVKMHHGRITVRSTPNIGTTMRVLFPTSARRADPSYREVTPENELSLDFSQHQS